MLFDTADAIAHGSVPAPSCVGVSTRFGLEVELATHARLFAWARYMQLPLEPWRSQTYTRVDGTVCQLTNVSGRWRGGLVRLHCLEPLDALTAVPIHDPADQVGP